MAEKSIIIIGAGLAGLTTGCYAQMNGYQTQIFEHHNKPGGVATCWKRKGYIIDGGIHFVMDHKLGRSTYELYRELGTAQANRFIDMTTYIRLIDETSGRILDVTQDLDRLANDLNAFSPPDTKIIDSLITGARAMQGYDMEEMMSKAPELIAFLGKLKQMWKIRRMFRYYIGKYSKPVEDFPKRIHDPWLRYVIKNMFLPEVPV